MKTIVQKTQFIDDNQIDLNYLYLQKYSKVLIIATREGQIGRVNQWLKLHNNTSSQIIGFWEMSKYLPTPKSWLKYNLVIFLDPDRCSVKDLYLQLIDKVSYLC